ncbi:50S ribosomal protein L25 [Rubrobacter taiwanensis]|jgi:large subunit ribosomal protein L25|uniref:Large ribosomal subunit protein bL25 n=1 Tax=Rubrobacter taiwanensis TaxID=185139 RepID=A0A4V2NX82_9ACTN|nr:50S ribosomal protein L25 [Rubrobacter taiwanensis]TCJ20282.1 50S ribosomal protein L25 [Rubrobacter taiwanensis]
MANVHLEALDRNESGKNAARRLRRSGFVPAILYRKGEHSAKLAVKAKTVDQTLYRLGDNAIYEIEDERGKSVTARIIDLQRDPITDRLLHVDFVPVIMTERIEVTVPITIVGEAPGVQEGGVLNQVVYEVQVETLPGNIPQELELDVSGLGMNENLTLADLKLPEGVTLLSDPEEVAVTISPPTEITEEEMEAAGVVEEPAEEEPAPEAEEEAAEGEEEE